MNSINNFFKKVKITFRKTAKKAWRNRISRRIIIGGGVFILMLAMAFFSYNLAFQNRIFPRTFIGGTNFGGLKREQAQEKLKQIINQSATGQLNFSWQNKTYLTNVDDLSIDYSSVQGETIDRLFAVGREGSLGKILKDDILSIFSKNKLRAAFRLNEIELNEYLMAIAKDIDKPEKDATIEIKDNQPMVIREEIGQKFAIAENQEIANEQIGSFSFPPKMPFRITKIYPKIDASTAQAAIPETEALLSHQLVLKALDKNYHIYPNDVAGMIEFVARLGKKNIFSPGQNAVSLYSLSPEISTTKVYPMVEKIAAEIYQEPKDPKFEATSGRVAAFQVAQTGYELEKDKAVSQIKEALEKGRNSMDLPVKVTEPALSSDDPAKLGLKELIGEGDTSWRGSPSNRIHNLTLGAEKISGTIVKPGEEFSTVKTLGEIDAAAGFLPELVIKNSTQVVPEYGGGLCQVSTTLFRAVLNSGLKITARTAHSFRVSYYEPPVGMDATVYDPAPDFKFVNNMDTPIFIWGIAGNNSLTFQIYGTKDGRKVDISEPWVGDYTSPPGDVYTMSDTMGPGEIRQTERATSGASASFTYKVMAADGTVLENETFVSKYVALSNSYLYGPGTTGIPGQEAAPPVTESTPAPTPTPTPTVKGKTTPKR